MFIVYHYVIILVPTCAQIADIGFIVDSSGSLRRDFGKEKEFINILASSFGISGDRSRAGIVTFSYDAVLTAKMSDHKDIKDFRASVDKIPYMGYTTRIDKALKVARDELFAKSNGARAGLPKILFVLTDGSQTKDKDAVDPASIAEEIRQKYGAIVFSIGIGQNVKRDELIKIASDVARVFIAKNFQQLKSEDFVLPIANSFCAAGNLIVRYLALRKISAIAQ